MPNALLSRIEELCPGMQNLATCILLYRSPIEKFRVIDARAWFEARRQSESVDGVSQAVNIRAQHVQPVTGFFGPTRDWLRKRGILAKVG
jgi:hypothetical protein